MYYTILDAYSRLMAFMDSGGPVLWWIAVMTLVMWTLAFERIWYYRTALRGDINTVMDTWEGRAERKSCNAKAIRQALISRISLSVNQNLAMIATLVALCPLMGLLGTVTGMIDVFNVMAVSGGGDAKSMAGGVSKATIPTMAGMVAALSGVFINTYLSKVAERENQLLADHLTTDH